MGAPERRTPRLRHRALPYLDLHVDDHRDPVAELRRVYEVAKVELLPFVEALPTREEPEEAMGEEIRGTLIPEG